jgi:hypothetical protein
VNDLLADGRMAEALSIFAASKAGEFNDIVAGLDPIARDAMQRKIIDEMTGGPDRVVKLLRRIRSGCCGTCWAAPPSATRSR